MIYNHLPSLQSFIAFSLVDSNYLLLSMEQKSHLSCFRKMLHAAKVLYFCVKKNDMFVGT